MRTFGRKPFGDNAFGQLAVEDEQVSQVRKAAHGFDQPENEERFIGRKSVDVVDHDKEARIVFFEGGGQLSVKLLDGVVRMDQVASQLSDVSATLPAVL